MTERVLVINLGWEQMPLITALQQQPVELYGIHYAAETPPGFAAIHTADLRDLASILAFADKVQPTAVISDQCDYSHFAQALIAERWSLPGPRLATAQIATNKWLQRSRAQAQGVRVPAFALCHTPEQARAFLAANQAPIILKPVDNRGSFGVSKVSDPEGLAPAFEQALIHSHSRWVLAEQWIQGQEITVDGYCFPGIGPVSLAVATKQHVSPERPVAMDIHYPGTLSETEQTRLLRHNEAVIRALGYTFGMTHSEYLCDPQGEIWLVEAANRGGGVYTSELIVPHVSGIDLVSQYIGDCRGQTGPTPSLPTGPRREALLKFFQFAPGTIQAFGGTETILANPATLAFRLAIQPGDTIAPITSDANRHGFLIAGAETGQAARPLAEQLLQSLEVTYV